MKLLFIKFFSSSAQFALVLSHEVVFFISSLPILSFLMCLAHFSFHASSTIPLVHHSCFSDYLHKRANKKRLYFNNHHGYNHKWDWGKRKSMSEGEKSTKISLLFLYAKVKKRIEEFWVFFFFFPLNGLRVQCSWDDVSRNYFSKDFFFSMLIQLGHGRSWVIVLFSKNHFLPFVAFLCILLLFLIFYCYGQLRYLKKHDKNLLNECSFFFL